MGNEEDKGNLVNSLKWFFKVNLYDVSLCAYATKLNITLWTRLEKCYHSRFARVECYHLKYPFIL